MNTRFDSYIFDMDGTLWDAVDTYCNIWNQTIADLNVDVSPITRQDLEHLMGTPLDGIYDTLVGARADNDAFIRRLQENSAKILPHLGGRLYDGVTETLDRLHRSARLFMVSNCGPEGLPAFLTYTGLKPLFTDALSFGATGVEKDVNIRRLVSQYALKAPLYIGDTAGDMAATHRAGIPFAWAAYGFGANVPAPEFTLHKFSDILSL